MTYIRVLPRDLFNEANLLKCLGKLWIALDETNNHAARIEQEEVDFFDIVQRADDGWTLARNVTLTAHGERYYLTRPLNSREPWPLYAERIGDPDFEGVPVFDDNGNLSPDMRDLIASAPEEAEK